MNVWTFTGRLGADGELRTTQGGDKVVSLRVANDVGFGERKTTQWVECSIWGKRAESLAPHLTKGKQVVISGEVTLREFQKRDGTQGAGLSVRVAEIDFTGGGQRDDAGQQRQPDAGGYGGAGKGAPAGRGQTPSQDDLDNDIPF